MLQMGKQKIIILSFNPRGQMPGAIILGGQLSWGYNCSAPAINYVSEIIGKRKNDYNCHLLSKLNNLKTCPKTYWSILKSFYSRKLLRYYYCTIIP